MYPFSGNRQWMRDVENKMKFTVMTGDEQILSLNVDPHKTVENVKVLLEVETQVLLQGQQLLYNGREMRNSEMLSALGVRDEDFIVIVSNAASSCNAFDTCGKEEAATLMKLLWHGNPNKTSTVRTCSKKSQQQQAMLLAYSN
ncbi:hypothetical protein DVH24_037759 [Malus domestica]|uniref:Ubiquitin-like domain-containing protein n=1 Tax=Malus domestica TaxID=3750 RepID=A0A498JXW4_MALDO|nr:hypothetical protein DVH24_037759 [Malus domestica]